MARSWLSITVELVEGRGRPVWPRPGRVFAVSRQHRFSQLATAIDDAFARWDRAHLHEFHLYPAGATFRDRPARVAERDPWGLDDDTLVPLATRIGNRLQPGQVFVYVFDLGDDWTHLCTVADRRIDPADTLGLPAAHVSGPLPYHGWGPIPDQYGRNHPDRADHDQHVERPDPHWRDLPPLRPWWGPSDPGDDPGDAP